MVKEVHIEGQSWNDVPWKFEPRTPNYVGAIGLAEAIRYIKKIGIDNIEAYERKLSEYLLKTVGNIKGLRFVGPKNNRAALLAFEIKGVHPHDLCLSRHERDCSQVRMALCTAFARRSWLFKRHNKSKPLFL